MALNIDINSSSIFAARDAVRGLEQEYTKLNDRIQELNQSQREEGKLTIKQQMEMEQLKGSVSSLNKEMNSYYETIDNLDNNNLTASFEDMYGAVKPLSTQISELEDRLYQMKVAGEANTEEFALVAERVGVMKAAIKEVDTEIDILAANNGVAGIKDQFGALGTSLANLDFKNAGLAVGGLTKKMKDFDPKAMAEDVKSFGKALGSGLVQAVKTVGKVFGALGKALLSNPIFLIVAIVVAIGAAMYALKDKVAAFQKFFDLMTIPIKAVIALFEKLMQDFNDFTDMLGLTNNAEQKVANQRADRYKKEAENVETLNTTKQGYLSNELKRLQANGVNTKEEIDQETKLMNNILKLEKEKTLAKISAAKTAIDLLKVKGNLSDEEKENLKKEEQSLKDLRLTINGIDTDIAINKQKAEEKKTAIVQKGNDDRKAKQDAANAKRIEAAKKAEAELLKVRQMAIDFLNKIIQYDLDHTYDLEEQAYQRDYLLLKDKLEKEQKEILTNKTLTGEERTKINDYYDKLNEANLKKRNAAEKAIKDENNKRILDRDIELNDTIDSMALKSLNKRLEEMKKANKDTLKLEKDLENEAFRIKKKGIDRDKQIALESAKTDEERALINTQFKLILEDAEQEHQDNLNKITEENLAKRKAMEEKAFNDTIAGIRSGMESVRSEYNSGYINVGAAVLTGITDINKTLEDESLSATDKGVALAGAALSMVSGILGGIQEQLKIETQASLNSIQESSRESMEQLDNNLKNGTISQEQYAEQKANIEMQTYIKEEAIKKKSFESDKKLKIAQATIGMVQGMVSAFTGAMSLGPIAGPIVGGILAAAVGAMGAMNIAKIKKTKYEAGTPPSGSTPAINLGGADTGRNDMIETGQNSDTSQGAARIVKPVEQPVMEVNATVSVTELNTVSNRVNKYNKSGEL